MTKPVDDVVTVKSLECRGILWQAIAEKTSLVLHRNLDKAVTCQLIVENRVVALMCVGFRSFKARDAALAQAQATGRFEVVVGVSRVLS